MLAREGGFLVLTVADDDHGFDPRGAVDGPGSGDAGRSGALDDGERAGGRCDRDRAGPGPTGR